MPFKFYPAESLPKAFDVAWCYFPYVEALGEPAEDEHPVLIKQPFIGPKGPEVDAVYGTSSLSARGPQFFTVPSAFQTACGFSRPTKFDVSRILRLPWCEEYFKPNAGGPPKLRHLHDGAVKEFQMHLDFYRHQRGQ